MEDLSVLNDIFRNAHTLKGMSATMGYNKIAELTHEMEDVLDLLRHEQLKLTEDIIDVLFKCLDSLEQMVDNVGNGDPEDLIDVSDLVAKLSALSSGDPAAAVSAAPAAEAPSAAEAPAAESASSGLGFELSDLERDVIKQAQEGGLRGFHLKVTLAESCLLKSARSYMVMNALDELGEVIKTVEKRKSYFRAA
jgi:two-component system chemotaxis sensor kinase CheA